MGISLRSRSGLLAASGLTFGKTCSVSHTHAKEGPLLPGLPLKARSFCGKVNPPSPPRPCPPPPPRLPLHFLILLLFSPKSEVSFYLLSNLQQEMPLSVPFL